MKVASVVLLLVLAVCAQAPQNLATQRAPAGPGGSVSGKVVSATTGEPLKKANVALDGITSAKGERTSRMQLTSTDSQGQFSFQNVEPGRYRLLASRNGYVAVAYGQRDATAPMSPFAENVGSAITVAAGQEIKDILLRLTPAGAISGRVVDEDGQPMVGVEVRAMRWMYMRGRRQLVPSESASTDDRGEYRIFRLNPGRYYLSATYDTREDTLVVGTMRGFFRGSGPGTGVREIYPPMFYPGTSDVTQAAAVELHGGDDIPGINFQLSLQRSARVSGRVFNAITGQAARGVHIQLVTSRTALTRGYNSGDHDTNTDQQGAFQLGGIAPGSYTVLAEWDGEGQGPGVIVTSDNSGERRTVVYGRRHYMGRQQVEVGSADVDNVSITIAPGTDVAGTLRIDGAYTTNRPNPIRIMLEATDDLSIGTLSTVVKPDNTFTIENVPDDLYRINFAGLPEGAFLKAARMGGQDVLEDGLQMIRNRRGQLDLVISMSAGRVDGTVLDSDGKPFAGARVALIPEGSRRKIPNLYRTATTDEYGRYSMRSVPPGDYKVFAWDSLEPGAYQDAEFLRPFESYGEIVHVSEGGQTTAEVKVITAETRGQ